MSRTNRIAGNLFALQTYKRSSEKMLWRRQNEVEKGRRETSLPSNFHNALSDECGALSRRLLLAFLRLYQNLFQRYLHGWSEATFTIVYSLSDEHKDLTHPTFSLHFAIIQVRSWISNYKMFIYWEKKLLIWLELI